MYFTFKSNYNKYQFGLIEFAYIIIIFAEKLTPQGK